jgi:RimJ/RimL family protein N-acetyltransferase
MILETGRLRLREFVAEDLAALCRVLCDRETMRFYPMSFDELAAREWITRNERRYATHGHGLWAMELKSTGEMIGDCGITLQEVDGESLREIGYHLRRDMWRQGLASEAARACRDYGFSELNAESLIALIRPENVPSRRVAESSGMTVWKQTAHAGMPHLVYRVEREGIG